LFGSPRQIELAQGFAESLANTRSGSLDELLKELREDLREELELEVVPRSIKHLRIISDDDQD
jgi:hypothetical protein